MLPALVFLALAAFAAALLGSSQAGRATIVHLMLAVGAMPLILGAMSHFIPVLTRTRAATFGLPGIPVLALAGGALAVISFNGHDMVWARPAGALLAATAATALLVWSRRRRAGMLGRPHPGLAWYETALACLILALLAILAGTFWPQHMPALRRLHLHLNTLGFIGLTAVSTLAVLLPTAAGRPDPHVAERLRRDLPWMSSGVLLIATGSAWFPPLAWIGAALWSAPIFRLAASWLQFYYSEIFALHGAAPLLAAALTGLVISTLLGTVNVFYSIEPIWSFIAGFMLPLVSGAASQLLPVWLRPGVQTEWHAGLRHSLGRYNGLRAVLFCSGGVAAGMGWEWGILPSLAALIWFLLQTSAALLAALNFQKRNPS
jgi:hypothetical protein